MKFIDEAVIEVRSGRGGAGAVHFMRQSYMPMMGPDGGDGGRGGDIYFEASTDLSSLLDFKYQRRYYAEDGKPGMGCDRNGKSGEDLCIKVPMGTVLYDTSNGTLLADLNIPGEKVLVLKGGRGGLGNMNFASSTRQAPLFAQPGETGEQKVLRLELKLLADVALVGFPNAGKSTLISRLTASKPKIASYPFTTLVPNLGVVRTQGGVDFVIADIPGLIEGASSGKGLGARFLKHCERSRVLVFLLDLDPDTGRTLVDEYKILDKELCEFSYELAHKPRIVALNKSDVFTSDPEKDPLFVDFLKERGIEDLIEVLGYKPLLISGVAGYGLSVLLNKITQKLSLSPRPWTLAQKANIERGSVELLRSK